jgi:hypothetical protein
MPDMPKGNLSTSRVVPQLRAPVGEVGCWQISGKKRLGVFLIVVLLIALLIASRNSGNQTAKPTTQEDSCRSDWISCADNEQLVNHYSD